MYSQPGADGYISPVALTRRLRFIPDRWEKGFSKQVQAWGSRTTLPISRLEIYATMEAWKMTHGLVCLAGVVG